MKYGITAAVVAGLLALTGRAAEGFSHGLSPADFAAAGLNRLTPAELERLDALISGQKNVAVTTKPPITPAVTVPAQTFTSAPPPDVRASNEAKPSLLERAKVLLTPGTEIEYATLDSELAEPFRGWEKGTILTLANGQRWLVTEGHYATPPVKGPTKVKVVPGALGSFFMEIEGGGKPRVKFLSKNP